MKRCQNCKIAVEQGSFCPKCGKPLENIEEQENSRKEAPENTVKTPEKADKIIRHCPRCKKFFNKAKFCYICGHPLLKFKPSDIGIGKQFTGYEIPLYTQYPAYSQFVELASTIKESTSSKIPTGVQAVDPTLFSIPAPKERIEILESIIKTTAGNWTAYVISYCYIFIIFMVWFLTLYEDTFPSDFINSIIGLRPIPIPKLFGDAIIAAVPTSLIISFIVLSPVIFLGTYTYRSSEMVLQFKIIPYLIFMALFANLLIAALGLSVPLILFPGDLKTRKLPRPDIVGSGLTQGVIVGITLTFIISILTYLFSPITFIEQSPLIPVAPIIMQQTFITAFLISSCFWVIMLMPFMSQFGMAIQESNKKIYWIVFTISMLLFILSFQAVLPM